MLSVFTHTTLVSCDIGAYVYIEGDISVSLETTTTYQQKGPFFVCFLSSFSILLLGLFCITTLHSFLISDDLGLHIMQKEAGIAHQNGDVDA